MSLPRESHSTALDSAQQPTTESSQTWQTCPITRSDSIWWNRDQKSVCGRCIYVLCGAMATIIVRPVPEGHETNVCQIPGNHRQHPNIATEKNDPPKLLLLPIRHFHDDHLEARFFPS